MKVRAYGLRQSDCERFSRHPGENCRREASQEKPQRQAPRVGSTGVRQDDLKENISLDPRAIRVCCGQAIEPRLAEIRDHSGATLFVSVWRCPYCDRATS
jgi:hypothetical protein